MHQKCQSDTAKMTPRNFDAKSFINDFNNLKFWHDSWIQIFEFQNFTNTRHLGGTHYEKANS